MVILEGSSTNRSETTTLPPDPPQSKPPSLGTHANAAGSQGPSQPGNTYTPSTGRGKDHNSQTSNKETGSKPQVRPRERATTSPLIMHIRAGRLDHVLGRVAGRPGTSWDGMDVSRGPRQKAASIRARHFRRRGRQLKRLGDQAGVLLARGVVEVLHRRLDVRVPHPLLHTPDVCLGDHPGSKRVGWISWKRNGRRCARTSAVLYRRRSAEPSRYPPVSPANTRSSSALQCSRSPSAATPTQRRAPSARRAPAPTWAS